MVEFVDCNALAIGNGIVQYQPVAGRGDTEFDSIAIYMCTSGYALAGNDTRVCQSDGTWSGSAPTCVDIALIDCGTLSIENGIVQYQAAAGLETTGFGSIATYTCNTGYELSGNDMRMCQGDGTWSGSAPICNIPRPTASTTASSTAVLAGTSMTVIGVLSSLIVPGRAFF